MYKFSRAIVALTSQYTVIDLSILHIFTQHTHSYTLTDASNQQVETAVQLDAERTGAVEIEVSEPGCVIADSDNDSSPGYYESHCSSDGSGTVPRTAGNLTSEIEEFIVGLRQTYKNILGRELQEDEEKLYDELFSHWNTFLQSSPGTPSTAAIISSDIWDDINKYIAWQEELKDEQWTEDNRRRIKNWLRRWNMFLQARAGRTLVTRWNVCLTIVGFILYIVDLASDISTSIYYGSNRQWWRALVTLAIVYGAVIIHTLTKWNNGLILCTGAADWLRYIGSLLVNWPDVQLYGALCLLEWQLHKSPVSNVHLAPEWHQRRLNVAYLKYTEGVWEACPQAILQLYLLLPDLYGAWTWTDYLRIAGALVSLCTAGAALVNSEKYDRITDYSDVALSELVVLHVWAVPVSVSRLLSVALLLSVHPYWALAGGALHLVLYGVYWCRTTGITRALDDVIDICLDTLMFFVSPFHVGRSVTSRRVYHAVHFLVNTAMMVVWALGTPLVGAHPALYTTIICFNAVMFAVGLVGWQLHENYWPDSYFSW